MTLVLNTRLANQVFEPHENGFRVVIDDPDAIDCTARQFEFDGYTPGDYSELIMLEMPDHTPYEIWAIPTITDSPETAECVWPPEKAYRVEP